MRHAVSLRAAVALLAVGGCLLTGCGEGSPATPAPTKPSAGKPSNEPRPGDFNGDGYDDFATVLTSQSKDRSRSEENLVVVYGSRDGLAPATAQRTSPGTEFAYFTSPLRTDLDGDGYTDLVVGRGRADSRLTTLALFGGARGLGPATELTALPADFRPLAAADFDGDGSTDLLDGGQGGTGDPAATVPGSAGLLLHGPFDSKGTPKRQAALDLDQHGYATPTTATTGDFDADGKAEVVFTYSFDAEEDESAPEDLHTVGYYEGDEVGLARDPAREPAITEAVETFDGPRTPATGDADGDGVDDLLLPTQLKVAPADMPAKGGALTILYGDRSGLGAGREKSVIEGEDGAKRRTDYGSSPATGDVNGDGRPDIVVDTPDFRRHDGKVTLLPGGPGGVPSAAGEQTVDAGTDGLPGTPNPHYWNAFDHQPPLLDVNGDDHADAVVFAPLYEKRKGAFLVLRGTDDGFTPTKTQLFTPDEVGVPLRLK
ncbi:VCBS repeat-containing protein [Streptomyces dioscori]|uniref:VCBS repeat-containing protein n=1 Tax=Streptomyces dioscori TaxID=2109333 RepID=A0A2P8Q637_9ACTN|nr:FG-GAP and VCBS repeat-containing protein [Streptomyces dioscori]PSM41728.1 VCBS repeat-containing protein [Streptomyces dioscori]